MKSGWLIGSVLLLTFAFFALSVYSRMEAYCFFYPGIDTRYAPGYSERKFNQITNGMTAEAVVQLLGTPLFQIPKDDGKEDWGYTLDGKSSWGDWAWLGRHVVFRDGKVVETIKHTYHD